MVRDFSADPKRRPPRIHLDMTMRQVLGADHSWDEGTWTALLHAVTDLAQDACDFADEINLTGDPERDAAAARTARERILAVISLGHQALMMFDAEQAETKAVQP